MTPPAAYTPIETIQEITEATIVRALSPDGSHVLLKILRSEDSEARRRLRHELAIGRDLAPSAALVPVALVMLGARSALVLHDFAGRPLEEVLVHAVPLDVALPLAVQLATALAALHASGVIHRDLKPQHIYTAPDGGVRLTGLGLALSAVSSFVPSGEPGAIEGTFAYMAPEQTGRTNRLVDQRADLYALGVVLYRMLAGRLPFEAREPIAWIHLHVAERPRPLPAGVPRPLAAIVDKLLAKDPDERYQTARGVAADLALCLAAWRDTRAIPELELGRLDIPDRLRTPQRLYGRDVELRVLDDALAATLAGVSRVVLLRGTAGIGKSSLARAVEAPSLVRGGWFLVGKHEELRADVPYFAVTQALDQLASRLLAEGDTQLATWRARLETALGPNAALLCALVPRFQLVLGSPAGTVAPSVVESPERFRLLLQRLFQTLASADHPLVLFLDDLQWADPATIALVEHVLVRPDMHHVLTLGAQRDDHVAPDHPLALAAERLRARGLLTELALPSLSADTLARLIADTFHGPIDETATLARLLHERTGGNPLFVDRLLGALYERRLIYLDVATARWRWELDDIARLPIADDAVALLLSQIEELPESYQAALRIGACLGIEFRGTDVAATLGRPVDEVTQDLLGAARRGLVLYGKSTFRFPHDRVREAAYGRIPAGERAEHHLRIGRALAGAATDDEDRSFAIADQLNHAAALITSRDERRGLAVLDLAVGRKAKAAGAHGSAARYLSAGLAQLDDDAWRESFATAYGLHLEQAGCALVLGQLDDAERLLRRILAEASTPAERAPAYAILVDIRMTRSDVQGAVALGIEGLGGCGITIDPTSTREQIGSAMTHILDVIAVAPQNSLTELPIATDPTVQAATDLLAHLGTPVFYHDPDLCALLVTRGVELALRDGIAPSTPALFAAFAWLAASTSGRYDEALRIGRLAHAMVQRPGFGVQRPLVCLIVGSMLNFWRHHVRTDLAYVEEAHEAAVQLGDLTLMCYAENHLVMTKFIMGTKLDTLVDESRRRTANVRAAGFDEMGDLMWSRHLLLQSLRGDGPGDAAAFEAQLAAARTPLTRCWHYIHTLQRDVLSGRYAAAIAAGAAAEQLLFTSPMFPIVGEHAFYYALALARGSADDPALATYLGRLEAWASSSAENFLAKYALVSAEVARRKGDDLAAMRAYELAIRSAENNGFVHVQALACELAADFYRDRGFLAFAEQYGRDALRCYARWGATAKVRELERARGATSAARPEELDLFTVTQASQALSAELVRGPLLERLLGVLLLHAGAQRCCFLRVDGDRVVPEAEARAIGVAPEGDLPEALLNYSRRTRERVLLQDANAPNPFSFDPYVRSRRPRSILCLPVVRQDRLLGLLYLENDLAPGVFGDERVEILELLAAQTAISLESATLVADLEREISSRREAEASLRASQEQLRTVFENMVDAVFVVDRNARVTFINQAGQRLLGVEHRKDALRPIADIDEEFRMRHPDGRPFLHDETPLARALLGEVVASVDATFTDREERDVHLRLSAAPIANADGEIVGAVAGASDVTEKLEIERLRDQFLQMVAHELKTPVAVVSGYAELLRARGAVAPAEAGMLDALLRGAARIDRVVSDLLFLWQLRAGRLPMVEESVDVEALLARVATRLEPTPAHPRIQLAPPTPIAIVGDRLTLEKVFTHLVDNALRYSAADSPVEIETVAARGGVEISVRDHGIGIPADKRARMFQPFFRAHAGTPRDIGGLGVGLYLANVIVHRHGGAIELESIEGKGSTFRVWLPIDHRANDVRPPTAAPLP